MGELKIVALVIGVFLAGAVGLKSCKNDDPGLFWKSGTSWVQADHCLVCGGKCDPIEKRGMKFQRCSLCDAEFLVPQTDTDGEIVPNGE